MNFKKFDSFVNEDINKSQLKYVEKIADEWLHKYGIDVEFTHHFLDRLNDHRNNPMIKLEELIDLFHKTADKLGKEFFLEYDTVQAVIKDATTGLNIPIVLEPDSDPREDTKLITKTIMRKDDFKTSNKVFTV